MPEKDTIIVFTARSPSRIVKEGGSQAWVLNPARAKLCKWVICAQNLHNPDHAFSDATEPHGSAFLVGKISAITPSEEEGLGDRWLIEISEFARIEKPGVWKRWRNPVRYASLAEVGIKVADLKFEPMPKTTRAASPQEAKTPWPPATYQTVPLHTASAATGIASFSVLAPIATMSTFCRQRLRASAAASDAGTLSMVTTVQPFAFARLSASSTKLS